MLAALAVWLAAGQHCAGFAQKRPATHEGTALVQEGLLADAPEPQAPVGQTEKNPDTTNRAANKSVPKGQEQPKRILGIMPNYRAVSAGAIPPPPTPKEAFVLATDNSFDYCESRAEPAFQRAGS